MKRIPERRVHKASGQDRCRYKGKDYYFGAAGSPESDERYRAWVTRLMANEDEPPTKVLDATVARVIKGFLDFAKRRYSSGEFYNCMQASRVLAKAHRKTTTSKFGPLALMEVRELMVAKGWPRTRINSQINRIRRMFRWGVAFELVHLHTVLALREVLPLIVGETTAPESEPIGPATPEQVAAILPQLQPTLRAMVQVHELIGMRPSELFHMKAKDIDQAGEIWVYRPRKFKQQHHGKLLAYAVGPKAQAILGPFLEGRASDEYLFKPAQTIAEYKAMRSANRKTKPAKKPRIKYKPAPRKRNEHYNRTTFRQALVRAVKRITGADKAAFKALYFHPNQLRHTKATAVRAEHGVEAARVALGHSNIDTTLIYAEADLAKAKEIARVCG